MNINAVGIDVSKRKSMVAILRPGREVVAKPFEVSHLSCNVQFLIGRIKSLEGESRIVMECTGHYYKPIAHALVSTDLFVSAVNPQIIPHY